MRRLLTANAFVGSSGRLEHYRALQVRGWRID